MVQARGRKRRRRQRPKRSGRSSPRSRRIWLRLRSICPPSRPGSWRWTKFTRPHGTWAVHHGSFCCGSARATSTLGGSPSIADLVPTKMGAWRTGRKTLGRPWARLSKSMPCRWRLWAMFCGSRPGNCPWRCVGGLLPRQSRSSSAATCSQVEKFVSMAMPEIALCSWCRRWQRWEFACATSLRTMAHPRRYGKPSRIPSMSGRT
mmetsp:Transcript_29509/g.80718  ORF Transcript_29509/g.80718 Transcript_29509/m.80718 type:complete len:205 (+) Transcript_29509:516-1130(+)